MEMVAEGNELLKKEEHEKTIEEVPSPQKTPETNAYKKAWNQILEKWKKSPNTAWRAAEIEQMIKGNLPKDRHYDEFVKLVAELGNTLSL